MGRRHGWLVAVVLLAFGALVGPGCSGGSGNGSSSGGQSCTSADQCTQWRCTCNDGTTVSLGECILNQCADANQACGGSCKNNGGLKSATPTPTVSTSAECDAFCAKAMSLHCPKDTTCDRNFWCALSQGECADQLRAELQCNVDTGSWSCDNGYFSVTSSCSSADCPAEAGAGDAGAD